MTREEVEHLVETQLLFNKKEIVDSIMTFQENPTAITFKDAENIPDALVGQSLDNIMGKVISELATQVQAEPSQKKNWVSHGFQLSHIQLKHGSKQQLRLEYFIPKRTEMRGRPRKKKTRGQGGTGCFPFAACLGIIAHASPALAEDVVLECLKDAYSEAADSLARRGIDMSWTRIQKIVNSVGRQAIAERTRHLSDIKLVPIANGKRIAVSMDGGRVQIRTSKKGKKLENGRHGYHTDWREPKLFSIHSLDENGRKERNGVQIYGCTMASPDYVVELIVAQLKAIGAANAECVVFLGDGAKWIWNRISEIAKKVGINEKRIRICLDYYHAIEHLTVLADAYPFGEQKKQEKWMKTMKKLLLEGSTEKNLEKLNQYRKRCSATIRREIQYFNTNAKAIGFAVLRQEKLPIGSGSIESAVRRVVNLRIKGAGIFWKMENVEPFIHLRCQLKSGNWNIFFNELISNLAC